MKARELKVGTRGSRLALVQTALVVEALKSADPGLVIQTRTITTTGDRTKGRITGDGFFTKEIQQALISGDIDLAVHSLKDLPTEGVAGLRIAGIPERGDPREALVGGRLADLPAGATIGTGSPRRAAWIRRLRPDLQVVPVRGNVPTRVEKVRARDLDAVLLAAAGLARLGIAPDEIFEPDQILPAPGQGALAVEAREDDDFACRLAAAIDHAATRTAVESERAVLRELGGGCLIAFGAYGRVLNGSLVVDASLISEDGQREARGRAEGDATRPEEVAHRLAADLTARGALELI